MTAAKPAPTRQLAPASRKPLERARERPAEQDGGDEQRGDDHGVGDPCYAEKEVGQQHRAEREQRCRRRHRRENARGHGHERHAPAPRPRVVADARVQVAQLRGRVVARFDVHPAVGDVRDRDEPRDPGRGGRQQPRPGARSARSGSAGRSAAARPAAAARAGRGPGASASRCPARCSMSAGPVSASPRSELTTSPRSSAARARASLVVGPGVGHE